MPPIVAPGDNAWVGELPERVRRRLDEVFGDVLPAVTRDELGGDEQAGAASGAGRGDEELLANRPPHHDRD
jgi:hypothetical protein